MIFLFSLFWRWCRGPLCVLHHTEKPIVPSKEWQQHQLLLKSTLEHKLSNDVLISLPVSFLFRKCIFGRTIAFEPGQNSAHRRIHAVLVMWFRTDCVARGSFASLCMIFISWLIAHRRDRLLQSASSTTRPLISRPTRMPPDCRWRPQGRF